MSMTYITVTDVTPVLLRPRFQSILGVIYGIASVVGPLIGNAIKEPHAFSKTNNFFQVALLSITLPGTGIFG